jgi:hypothetical protein
MILHFDVNTFFCETFIASENTEAATKQPAPLRPVCASSGNYRRRNAPEVRAEDEDMSTRIEQERNDLKLKLY